MVGPSKQYVEESRQGHEKLIEGWRKAVQAAEKANSDKYWPVHLNGEFLCADLLFASLNDSCTSLRPQSMLRLYFSR